MNTAIPSMLASLHTVMSNENFDYKIILYDFDQQDVSHNLSNPITRTFMCPLPCFGPIEIRNLSSKSKSKISLTSQPEKQEWEIVTITPTSLIIFSSSKWYKMRRKLLKCFHINTKLNVFSIYQKQLSIYNTAKNLQAATVFV